MDCAHRQGEAPNTDPEFSHLIFSTSMHFYCVLLLRLLLCRLRNGSDAAWLARRGRERVQFIRVDGFRSCSSANKRAERCIAVHGRCIVQPLSGQPGTYICICMRFCEELHSRMNYEWGASVVCLFIAPIRPASLPPSSPSCRTVSRIIFFRFSRKNERREGGRAGKSEEKCIKIWIFSDFARTACMAKMTTSHCESAKPTEPPLTLSHIKRTIHS